MTTFATRPSVNQAAPRSGETASEVVVRWALARTASGGAAVLSISVSERGAGAVLAGADGVERAVGSGGPARVERVDGIEHVDVSGVVSLSLRRGEDGRVELLYARTPLLQTLGVPGGCCERPEIVAPAN
jgi:hypothetical protein